MNSPGGACVYHASAGSHEALVATTAKHTVGSAVCSADGTQDAMPSGACVRGTGPAARSCCVPEDDSAPNSGALRPRSTRTAVQTAYDAIYAQKLRKTLIKESRTRGNTVRGVGKPRARSAHLSSLG